MAKRRKKKQATLSELDWARVFDLRCQTKQGRQISPEDRKLIDAAYAEDEERYAALEGPVFDATVPFGSGARWGQRGKKP